MKRLFDTAIIQQAWYMDLPPADKALWWELYAMMDNAGVFEINTRMIEVMFGEPVDAERIFTTFAPRIQQVPDHPNKGIFVDYVAWANAGHLSAKSPSQRSIIARLEELGLTLDALNALSRKRVNAPQRKASPSATRKASAPQRNATQCATATTPQRMTRPTLQEIESYIADHNYSVDAQRFMDYYESNGWRVGRNPMKDWRAAVRTWQHKGKEFVNGNAQNANRAAQHSSNWRGGQLADQDKLF